MTTARIIRLRTLLCALAGVVAGASALPAGSSPWYVEAKLGETRLEASFGSRQPQRVQGDAEAAGFEVGRVVNRYLAIQAGYHDLGDYEDFGHPCRDDDLACHERLANQLGLYAPAVIAAEITGFSFAVVPRWPLTERLSIYGKAGVLDWTTDLSRTGGGSEPGLLGRFSDRDVLGGAGLRYDWRRGLGVQFEYLDTGLDLTTTTVGASWRF